MHTNPYKHTAMCVVTIYTLFIEIAAVEVESLLSSMPHLGKLQEPIAFSLCQGVENDSLYPKQA